MALLMPSATVLAMATPWLQRFWAWRPRTLGPGLGGGGGGGARQAPDGRAAPG